MALSKWSVPRGRSGIDLGQCLLGLERSIVGSNSRRDI